MPQETHTQEALKKSDNAWVGKFLNANFTIPPPLGASQEALDNSLKVDLSRGVSLDSSLTEEDTEKIKKNYNQSIGNFFGAVINVALKTGEQGEPIFGLAQREKKISVRFYKKDSDIYADTTISGLAIQNAQEGGQHSLPGVLSAQFKLTGQGFQCNSMSTSNSLLKSLLFGNGNVEINAESTRVAQEEELKELINLQNTSLQEINPSISIEDASKIIQAYKTEGRSQYRQFVGKLFQSRAGIGMTQTVIDIQNKIKELQSEGKSYMDFNTFKSIMDTRDTRKHLASQSSLGLTIRKQAGEQDPTEKVITTFIGEFSRNKARDEKLLENENKNESQDKNKDKNKEDGGPSFRTK